MTKIEREMEVEQTAAAEEEEEDNTKRDCRMSIHKEQCDQIDLDYYFSIFGHLQRSKFDQIAQNVFTKPTKVD